MTDTAFRPVARGAPARLSQRDVDRMARGESDGKLEAKLASQPLYRSVRPKDAARARFAPIAVEADELRVLRETGEADRFLDNLEAVSGDAGRSGKGKAVRSRKAAPTEQPEG